MTASARLVRLAALRSASAARIAAAAEARLAAAVGEEARAAAEAQDLARRLEARRAGVRAAFLGAPQARTALLDLVATLDGFMAAEAAAAGRIADAARVAAIRREELGKARAALVDALRVEARRGRLHDLVRAEARRRADRRDEAEAEEARGAFAAVADPGEDAG